MARGSGNYGNLPPGMGNRAPRPNPAIQTSGGKSSPMNPIGPGNPKNKPSPDMTMAKVTSPIGPGQPRTKSQPSQPGLGNNPGRSTGTPRSTPTEGKMRSRKQPDLPGIPGREGGVKPRKNNSGYGKGGMNKGSGGTKAAGVPPGYGP